MSGALHNLIFMSSFARDFTIRHPSLHDAQATLDLVVASDVAECGEPDSSLEDLLDQRSDIDLERNAPLMITPQNQPIVYATVFGGWPPVHLRLLRASHPRSQRSDRIPIDPVRSPRP
jgi:hypothetical protein